MRLATAVESKRLRRFLLVAAALLAAPLWLWFQFPGYLSKLFVAIPGEVWGRATEIGGSGQYYGGDQVQILYLAWKLKQNLLHHWSILTDHFTFAARAGVQRDLAFGPQLWLIAFLSLFVGDIAAYNLGFVILPLSFTFLAGYYLTGAATRSIVVRSLLAAGMTIVPLRICEMMMGHSTGSVWWLVPLYWGIVLRRRMDSGGRHGDAAAGAILFVTTIAEEHQGFYLLISSAMVFVVWALQDAWPLRQAPRALARLAARWKFFLVGVAAVAAWGWFYERVLLLDAQGHPHFERPGWDIKLYSQPLRYFLALDGQSNIGALLVRGLAVAIVAITVARRGGIKAVFRSPYLGVALALPIALFLTVGLGPDWSQNTGIYDWFYTHVPFFSAQRVSIKMFTIGATFIAVLCAAGYQVLVDEVAAASAASRRLAATTAKIGLSILMAAIVLQPCEYSHNMALSWPGLLLTDMRWGPQHLFFYLRNHLNAGDIVLTVPFNIKKSRWETFPDYLAYRGRVRFADGYFGQHPHYFEALAPDIASFNTGAPTAAARALARNVGYTYLLLNRDQWPLPTPVGVVQSRLDGADWLQRVQCDQEFCLYAFR